MKTKVKNTVIIVAALAAGYTAGVIIGFPKTSGNLGSGDISKVSKFHKESVSEQHSAYEEKLLADSQAMQDEVISTGVLAQKLVEFSDLVDRSVEVAGDIEELGENVNALKELQELSANAAETAMTAVDALENLGNGNNLGISYEQASQNLMVAYIMVDNQACVGKEFAIAADEYYVNHRELSDLADIRDSWAQFCCECALLKGTEEGEQQYWASNTDAKLSDLSSIKVLSRSNTIDRTSGIPVVSKNDQAVRKANEVVSKNGQAVSKANAVVSKNDQAIRKANEVVSKNGQAVSKANAVVSKNGQAVSKANAVVSKNGMYVSKMNMSAIAKNGTSLNRTVSSIQRYEIAAQRANEAVRRNEQTVKKAGEMAGKNNNGQKKY